MLILTVAAPLCLELLGKLLPERINTRLAVVAVSAVLLLVWGQVGSGFSLETVLFSSVSWFGLDSGNLHGENASLVGCVFFGVAAVVAGYFVGSLALISIPKHSLSR